MKLSDLTVIFTGLTFCSISLFTSQSARASSNKYFCAQLNGTYHTFARTERSTYKLLSFTRTVSDSWTEKERCLSVSQRFQSFYDNGSLKFIGAGEVNNEPVLCAAATTEDICNTDNILVTLPPNTDAIETARQLMDVRNLASGRVIEVNGKTGKLETYANGTAYYDLAVLEQLIIEKGDENF
jgi:hypothetical protein